MTISLFLAALLGLQSTPQLEAKPYAPPPQLSAESQAQLRCSAAFALVSYGQVNGNEAAQQWPSLDERGREFFVRVMARLMDETGLDRDGVAELAKMEAQRLIDNGDIGQVMPSCLVMLDQSGL